MMESEISLIKRIREIIGKEKGNVIIGPGDDTAVLKGHADKYLLFTCDCLVENIHFSLNYTTPQDLGWKALAINASDIAAMGGFPKYATVSLILNEKINAEWVERLYEGLKEFTKEYPVSLVGGNISRCQSSIVVDIAMIGEVKKDRLIRRSNAKVGDLIVVTGTLGDSSAGMKILKNGGDNLFLCRKHLRPVSRLKEIREITSKVKMNSLIDISDGLTQDLFRILEESKVSASIDTSKIPLSSELKKFAKDKALYFALEGGEDYELLFTLSKKEAKKLPSGVNPVRSPDEKSGLTSNGANGTTLTVIGEIIKGEPKIFADGKKIIPRGFNHFRPKTTDYILRYED